MSALMARLYENEKEDGDSTGNKENNPYILERDTWGKKIDFIFSTVGCAVGLGNIWRFPYLCYKHGGGTFLITYLVSLICGGVPMFILEIALGQYMRKGGLSAWDICPLFKGIGVATMVIVFLMNIYYIMILCWSVFYFVMSFKSRLPWSHCDNPWNTDRCRTTKMMSCQNYSISTEYENNTLTNTSSNYTAYGICGSFVSNFTNTSVDPVIEFWERRVIQISDGIDTPGHIVWELAMCLLFAWVIVYLCVCKGIRWTGKIVYFTALFPYVILTILLIRGVTLEGAAYGIEYYLKPNFTKLKEPQVWVDGGTQIFFSYAIALGVMITLGSYNKFNHNFYRDCFIIMSVNSGTSLYGGFAVFSVLGFMATKQGVHISEVAESGPSIAFLAYPKALTEMPFSQLWSVLFFFMLFLVGLDSEFVAVEAFITPIVDRFPRLFYKQKWRLLLVAVYCFVSFLIGLCMTTQGGIYVFQIFDYYSASGMVLLWLLFWESIVIGWIFGADRFYDALELMLGYRITVWWKICWKFLTPLITLGILLFQIVKFVPLKYNNVYTYPFWAQGFGICMAVASIICVPAVLITGIIRTRGSLRQRLNILTTPILKADQIPTKWMTDNSFKWNTMSNGCINGISNSFDIELNNTENTHFITTLESGVTAGH